MSGMTENGRSCAEAIASGSVVEDQRFEFKREVDLSDPRKKRDFVDDVVAFPNGGPGRIVVGVAERSGRCERFVAVVGDRDAIARRFLSVIQDNVLPRPLGVSIGFIDVEGGCLIDVVVPEHSLRPYQNGINGAFIVRTGAKNTPVSRDAVRAMFTPIEAMEADAARLMEREDRAVEARAIMQVGCPTLHVAIDPGAHYDRSAAGSGMSRADASPSRPGF